MSVHNKKATGEVMKEFIEIYRRSPCLWDPKSKDYNSQRERENALLVLKRKLRETFPHADRTAVLNQLHILRTDYFAERKRVRASIQSGAIGDYVYRPNSWCYKLLEFLSGEEKDESNDEVSVINVEPAIPLVREANFPDSSQKCDSQSTDPVSVTPERSSTPRHAEPPERSAEKRSADVAFPPSDGEIDSILGNVGAKLRRFSRQQRIIAEKLISEVLYNGELGTLDMDSKLLVRSNP